MALPQTIDPSTLNLSGRPAMATTTAPSTTTSAGSPGYAMPRVEDVKNEVPPALGALFGGMLGYAAENRKSTGSGGSGSGNANAPGGNSKANPLGSVLSNLIKNAGKPPTTPGSTPTGDIGSVNSVKFPAGTTQETIDAQYGKTNGQSNVVISGVNPGDGQVIATPNYDIGGGNLSGNGSATGNQTEPGGGGYDPNVPDTEQYYTNDNGDIYDYAGDLMFAYNNGYYMDPTDYSMYDATTFDPVDGQSVYANFFDIPVFDSSGTTSLDGYDFSDYSPSDWGSFYVKDGGSINKSGLPTPLFANGGGVRGYADGSLIEAATAMAPSSSLGSTPVAMAASTPSTGTDESSFGDLISGLLSNKTLTGAGLGAILTSLINSNSTQPVNKGVNMTALGTLKPRTTPVGGPAKFVPYSEYGTPTAPYDYSTLYNNLGVSPFGGSTGAAAPTLSPTAPGATPTTPTAPVTAPTGGLPTTTAPTGTTPVAPAAPLYYADDDGNIYDADGNLVYDSTTSTATPSTGVSAAPVVPSASPLAAAGTLAPTSSGDSYYSYGTAVTPSSVLGVKKGGSIKMADGGLSDLAVTSLAQDPTKFKDNGMQDFDFAKQDKKNFFAMMGQIPGYEHFNNPEFQTTTNYDEAVQTIDPTRLVEIDPRLAHYFIDRLPKGPNALPSFSNPNTVQSGDVQLPGQFYDYKNPYEMEINDDMRPIAQNNGAINNDFPDDFPIRTIMGDTPLPYERVTTTNAPSAPSFSPSPTFRLSGANNPLLTGLSQGPAQQPYIILPDGTFGRREELSTSRQYAEGGDTGENIPYQTNLHIPQIDGRNDYREGGNYVEGPGDGQSDDIPAMLADGEYVIDAETVAQLGNGSNKAGARILDEFRENIRSHKRSAPTHKIPPKSKSALAYLKGAK